VALVGGRRGAPKERGDRGEPHHGVGGHQGGTVCPGKGETKRRQTELDGSAIRVRMERANVRNGKVVWRRCSRVAFIGRGRRKGGGQGVIRQWLGGA
jgi:hypothetical protein